MTTLTTIMKKYDPHFVGFEPLFNQFRRFEMKSDESSGGYPPYNIIKLNESQFVIELAIAGFAEKDVKVLHEPEHNRLVIEGSNEGEEQDYVYQGIASRKVRRSWTVSDHIIVKNAKLSEGILRVELENVIPDERKPKEIEIEVS